MLIDSKLLFPRQVVSVYTTGLDLPGLLSLCYDERSADTAGVAVSNKNGGWQSRSIEWGDPKYNALMGALGPAIFDALREGMGVRDDIQVDVSNFWLNISGANAYNSTHIHPGATFSGVFYVKACANCGNIVFEDDQHRNLESSIRTEIARSRTLQYASYYWTPTEGTLLMFPAVLSHSVGPNLSGDDRVSIAFNI